MEKTLTIKIDEKLHREIKSEIAMRGLSVKEYLLALIKSDFEKHKQKQA